MVGDEILLEIDSTLDRLIGNAEAFEQANLNALSEVELEAFQKTQESLLHHFLNLDSCLQEKKESLKKPSQKTTAEKVEAKKTRFEKLKRSYSGSLERAMRLKRELTLKRRRKKLLQLR